MYFVISCSFQWCLSEHGYLVEIGSEREQLWIEMLMASDTQTGAYWIGLSDETQEGIWVWQNSFVEASFANWTSGNPHVDRTMNCAHMSLPLEYEGTWYDIDCKHDRAGWGIHAICEMENTG